MKAPLFSRSRPNRSGIWSPPRAGTFDPGAATTVFTNAYSVEFDGVDEYMDCGTGLGDALGDNYAGSLTVSLWFKADTMAQDRAAFYIGSFAGAHGPFTIHTASNFLYVSLANSTWYRQVALTDTSWHHTAVVYAAGSEANSKLYLDATAVGYSSGTFPASTAMDFAGLKTIVGAGNTTSRGFDGKIDEVAIFTSALSAANITAIYGGGTPTDLTSLSPVSWWRMGDSGTGSSAVIDVAGDNTGALYNNPSYELDVPAA